MAKAPTPPPEPARDVDLLLRAAECRAALKLALELLRDAPDWRLIELPVYEAWSRRRVDVMRQCEAIL